MRRPLLIKLSLLLATIFILAAAQPAAAQKVVLQLRWFHQFQFAGYYMAAEQGYYRDAGLEVEIRPRSKERIYPLDEVLSGRADFGISDAALVEARSLGKPVVAVATIFQESPSVYLSLESSGINKPADFIGKKIPKTAGSQASALKALLAQEHLLQKVKFVDSTYDYKKLISGEIDVIGAYRTDQPYQLKRQGYPIHIINPVDYGINFYGDTLFTSEDYLQKNPEIVEKFRKASLRGWQYALDHSDEAIAVIKLRYNSQKSIDELHYEATEIKKIIKADQIEIGSMDLLQWGKNNHYLIALGLISPDFYLSKDFFYEAPQGIPWSKLQGWIIGVVAAFILFVVVVALISKKNFQLRAIRKQLEKEKNFSTSLVDTAHIIILVLDVQGNIISFNPYMENLTGYSLSEVEGKNWFTTFLPKEGRDKIHTVFQEVIRTSNIHGQVNQILTKDGEYLDIEWDNEILTGSAGEQLGILAIGRNITENLKSQDELRKYSQIISATADLMSFIDRNYIYRAVNQAYLDAHGKTFSDLINHSVAEVMGPAFFESLVKEKIDQCFAGEEVHYQTWFDFPGIGKKYMDIVYSPYQDVGGKVTGIVASARDSTNLKQLQDEQLQLLQAISQMNEAIIVTNLDAEIQYVNPAFEKISGYSIEEAVGQNPRLLQSGQTDPSLFVELWKTLTAGNVWHGQFHNKKKDGSLYIEDALISPVVDSFGATVNYIAVKRDVTHELELEEQIRQKFKMETVGLMAGGMAHNFNNNLAIILGNLDLAKMRMTEQSDVDAFLENARIAVFRARDLIQNILTYSRQDPHEKLPVQLVEIIEETYTLLQATIPATVKLKMEIDSVNRDLSIYADASQLQEVLLNLCTNAVHAMDETGDLTVSLKGVELCQSDIPTDKDLSPGCFAKICVQDTGQGISPEILGQIFEPFFTTKALGEGTGMGLATVQRIVSEHDGKIRVKSNLGQGSCFELYFPIIERRQKKRPATVVPQLLRGGCEKILFVDDEEMLTTLWNQILREKGYQVTTMTNSVEALKLFTANPDFFDLVVTDQTMPGLTGEEMIKGIFAIRPDIPIILCTGYSSKISKTGSEALGIAGFCMKPHDQNEMLPLIRTILDKTTTLDS